MPSTHLELITYTVFLVYSLTAPQIVGMKEKMSLSLTFCLHDIDVIVMVMMILGGKYNKGGGGVMLGVSMAYSLPRVSMELL